MISGRQLRLDTFIVKAQRLWEQIDCAPKSRWVMRIMTFLAHLLGFAYVALLLADLRHLDSAHSQTTLGELFLPALAFGVVLIGMSNAWMHMHMPTLAALRLPDKIEIFFWRGYYEFDRARAHVLAFLDTLTLPQLPVLPLMAQLNAWFDELTQDDGCFNLAAPAVNLFDTCERLAAAVAPISHFTRTPRAVNLLC
ncbi:MAG: hypothetical protein KIH69_015525 [Anaerolineae bacterium]|nr:hypothetical protein [Anaerolineae bacterium]